MSETQGEIVEPAQPEIIHEGAYRLYSKPDGGMHLVYKRVGSENEDHLEIPGALVALMHRMEAGSLSPMDMMREMMKLRRG